MASQKQVYKDHNGLALVELEDHHKYGLMNQNAVDIDKLWIGYAINFQNGPVKDNGLNGWQNEHIVAMLIHRITELDSKFPCIENKMAIMHLKDALDSLNDRTKNRIQRGVEGENKL
jgi:hypothetical protein